MIEGMLVVNVQKCHEMCAAYTYLIICSNEDQVNFASMATVVKCTKANYIDETNDQLSASVFVYEEYFY